MPTVRSSSMPILQDRRTDGKGNYAFSPAFFRPAETYQADAKTGFVYLSKLSVFTSNPLFGARKTSADTRDINVFRGVDFRAEKQHTPPAYPCPPRLLFAHLTANKTVEHESVSL